MSYDWNEILGWFDEDSSLVPEPTEVIYANYADDGYDGQANVLFYDNGKFWYVSGSHCSCYGLEDQWNPEEYTPETLKGQVERATYGFFVEQKDLIMKAVEKYESPLAQLAAELAYLDRELGIVNAEWIKINDKRNELTRQHAQTKAQLKAFLID